MSLDALNHVAGFSWGRRVQGYGAIGGKIGFALAAPFKVVVRWHHRSSQRLALLALDQRMLDDIGLTRANAEAEAAKPFWRE